jgi:OOP family OmpA-OmpF porin
MLIRQATAATLMTVLLAACGGQNEKTGEPAPAVTPEPTEASPDPQEPVSILRPEIEQPEAPEPPLADLRRVVGFPGEGTDLSAAAQITLQQVLASPQIALGGPIVLRGHSDAGGDDEEGLAASRARAGSVRAWMVDNGIEAERITLIAFGDQNPIAPNLKPDGTANPQGRARNRRVEIEIPAAFIEPAGTQADEMEESESAETSD